MDPLSVTASVAGLLSAAAKIYTLLDAIASAKNAPKTIRNAQAEVRHFELTLRSLRRYLWQLELVDTRRRDLICLDEVIAPLTDVMLELSEFEKLLDKLTNLTTLRSFVTWFSYEKTVEEHLARIMRQKTSLVMTLNIIQCESDQEAFRSQRQLQDLVGEILSENKVLKGKLEQLEDSFDSRSTFMPRLIHESRSENHSIDDAATIKGVDQHSTVQNGRQGVLGFAFETVLEQSWVYQRNTNRNCDCSFVSSAQRSHAWSVFSEYSLADISILSVIAMPITAIGISNGIYYTTESKATVAVQSDQKQAGESVGWSGHKIQSLRRRGTRISVASLSRINLISSKSQARKEAKDGWNPFSPIVNRPPRDYRRRLISEHRARKEGDDEWNPFGHIHHGSRSRTAGELGSDTGTQNSNMVAQSQTPPNRLLPSHGPDYLNSKEKEVNAFSDLAPQANHINHNLSEGKSTQQPDDKSCVLDNDSEGRIAEANTELLPCDGVRNVRTGPIEEKTYNTDLDSGKRRGKPISLIGS